MLSLSGASAADGTDERLQNALLSCLGRPRVEVVQVDVGASLSKQGLAGVFPIEVSPPTFAVREMATKIKAKRKQGEEHVFLFVDLKKCVELGLNSAAYSMWHMFQVPPAIMPRVHVGGYGESQQRCQPKGSRQEAPVPHVASCMGRILNSGCGTRAG